MTTDVIQQSEGSQRGTVSASQMAALPEMTQYKNRLQEFTQKLGLPLPTYITRKEGLIHAPKFRGIVEVDGIRYVSDKTFTRAKAAEQDAARCALEKLSEKKTKNMKEESRSMLNLVTKLSKAIMNEFAVKISVPMPEYSTKLEDGVFVSDVQFCGKTYRGLGKNKKEAEQQAARVVIETILDNSLSRTVMSDIIYSKVNKGRDDLHQSLVISSTPTTYGNLLACSNDQAQTDPIGDFVHTLPDGTCGKKRRQNEEKREEALTKKQRPEDQEESQDCQQMKQPEEEQESEDTQTKKGSKEEQETHDSQPKEQPEEKQESEQNERPYEEKIPPSSA